MRVHSGEKPYVCKHCSRAFSDKSNLKRHLKTHPNKNSSKSQKNEGKDGTLANTEQDTQEDESKLILLPMLYKCEHCQRDFTLKSNLIKHMRLHTGEKPYSCSKCNKAFAQKSNMTRHMRFHLSEKTFECEKCRQVFYDTCSFLKHGLLEHGVKCKRPLRKLLPKDPIPSGVTDVVLDGSGVQKDPVPMTKKALVHKNHNEMITEDVQCRLSEKNITSPEHKDTASIRDNSDFLATCIKALSNVNIEENNPICSLGNINNKSQIYKLGTPEADQLQNACLPQNHFRIRNLSPNGDPTCINADSLMKSQVPMETSKDTGISTIKMGRPGVTETNRSKEILPPKIFGLEKTGKYSGTHVHPKDQGNRSLSVKHTSPFLTGSTCHFGTNCPVSHCHAVHNSSPKNQLTTSSNPTMNHNSLIMNVPHWNSLGSHENQPATKTNTVSPNNNISSSSEVSVYPLLISSNTNSDSYTISNTNDDLNLRATIGSSSPMKYTLNSLHYSGDHVGENLYLPNMNNSSLYLSYPSNNRHPKVITKDAHTITNAQNRFQAKDYHPYHANHTKDTDRFFQTFSSLNGNTSEANSNVKDIQHSLHKNFYPRVNRIELFLDTHNRNYAYMNAYHTAPARSFNKKKDLLGSPITTEGSLALGVEKYHRHTNIFTTQHQYANESTNISGSTTNAAREQSKNFSSSSSENPIRANQDTRIQEDSCNRKDFTYKASHTGEKGHYIDRNSKKNSYASDSRKVNYERRSHLHFTTEKASSKLCHHAQVFKQPKSQNLQPQISGTKLLSKSVKRHNSAPRRTRNGINILLSYIASIYAKNRASNATQFHEKDENNSLKRNEQHRQGTVSDINFSHENSTKNSSTTLPLMETPIKSEKDSCIKTELDISPEFCEE